MLINSILKASSIFKNKQYQQKLAGIAANSGICKNNNILKNVKPPINLTFSGGKINLDEKVINSITNKTLKDPYQQAYTGYIYSCVEALNSSNPKELVFLIDNKTGECIAKAAGDAVSHEHHAVALLERRDVLRLHAAVGKQQRQGRYDKFLHDSIFI